jgi:uncharacterized glyoxalase superfamily protein PhnB
MTDTITAEPLRADALYPSLTVSDLQKSLAWYRDVLGLEVEREMARDGVVRAIAMRAGAVRFLINQDDGAKGHNRARGGCMSMNIATHQSVDAVAAHIKAHGGSLLTEPADMPWGMRVFRVADPDGYLFAVSALIAPPA